MRRWTPHLTTRLAGLRLAPAREAEIIEELSQHLDDRYDELRREGANEADAERLALDEIDDHELLRRELGPLRQASLPPRDGGRTLEGYAAFGGLTASLNADGETDLVSGAIVTGNYFEQLGVTAGQGRLLSPADDVMVGGHPVAVVSDRLWRRRFGGRADIVGHEILLNGHAFTIVGVTRPGFIGAQLGTTRDRYVPMMVQAVMRPPRAGYSGEMNPDLLKNAGNSWLFVALGVVIGLGAAFFVMRWLSTFLYYGISPRDTMTFTLVPAILIVVALVACLIPARRAVRVNPLTALRAD